ncbi:methylenetetrahydrofolate reductase [NAD(P)H] [soil metagenome]
MAKIADLLAAGRTFSFEFFPPKTDQAARALEKTVAELAELEPSFVSVTYGALGTTREPTRDLVIAINREQPFPAMPHLTCVGHTRAQLRELLAEYHGAGIENILALAGDPPADGSESGGDFAYATELVELVREAGDFGVAVAAFPEIHPRSPDRETDRRFLAAKLQLADFGMAQFFFEVDHFLRMRDELDALGCTTPLLPGVMPFISVSGTRRMAGVNGTEIPVALDRRLDHVDADTDPEAVRRLGVEVASELCARLLAEGVAGLHLYSMNRSSSVREIYANLGLGPAGG